MSNARCWKRQVAALAIATSLLSGCATVGSDRVAHGTCPPVVAYSREFQARAAEELALLPEGSVIMGLISDYAVMREQARACRSPRRRVLVGFQNRKTPKLMRPRMTVEEFRKEWEAGRPQCAALWPKRRCPQRREADATGRTFAGVF